MAPKAPRPPVASAFTAKSFNSTFRPMTLTQYNNKTGRPIRASAGKVKQAAGYVDSSLLEEEDFTPWTSDSSDDEDEDDMRQHHRATRKRKRSPSPPSPQLAPIIHDQDLEQLTDNELGGAFHHRDPKIPPISLQFNVPLGFHGPLFVKLDHALLQTNSEGKIYEMQSVRTKMPRIVDEKPTQLDLEVRPKGFTDLPPELRNSIYMYLFACKTRDLKIPPSKGGNNLSRSGQFLRTCKLVHGEGCSVLYGENTFHFVRHFSIRGPFWEPLPKEIGYQDVLHFLKMIGPENLQYLRDIEIDFDDACPRDTPYLNSNEKRRYLNDEYLISCLRILRSAKLRTIAMRFYGRRQVVKSDVKFLGYLEQIKADEVIKPLESWHYPGKMSGYVWEDLKKVMTRKKKLYGKK